LVCKCSDYYAYEVHSYFYSVNMVVPPSDLLPTAIRVAQQITRNSPDAVQSTKRALLLSQSHGFEDTVQQHVWSHEGKQVYSGANIKVRASFKCRTWMQLLNTQVITGGIEGICRGM